MSESLFNRINKNISPLLLVQIVQKYPTLSSIEQLFETVDRALTMAENEGVSICPICGSNMHGHQHDAEPVFKGVCCDNCYKGLVTPIKKAMETFEAAFGQAEDDTLPDLGMPYFN